MHARLRGPKRLSKPDFPSLADEIAEPCPDMNIKAAAFTVNEKSSNTFEHLHKTVRQISPYIHQIPFTFCKSIPYSLK